MLYSLSSCLVCFYFRLFFCVSCGHANTPRSGNINLPLIDLREFIFSFSLYENLWVWFPLIWTRGFLSSGCIVMSVQHKGLSVFLLEFLFILHSLFLCEALPEHTWRCRCSLMGNFRVSWVHLHFSITSRCEYVLNMCKTSPLHYRVLELGLRVALPVYADPSHYAWHKAIRNKCPVTEKDLLFICLRNKNVLA